MARAVERIEQELAVLDRSVVTMAQEFHDTYSQYLTVLSQAVRQQLILASYHLCTHGYPEQFLQLSLQQRQQLQQSLRQLAQETRDQLATCIKPIQPTDSVPTKATIFTKTSVLSASGARLSKDEAEAILNELDAAGDLSIAIEIDEIQLAAELESIEALERQALEAHNLENEDEDLESDNSTGSNTASDLQLDDASSQQEVHSDAEAPMEDENDEGEEDDEEYEDEDEDEPDLVVADRPLQPRDILRWQERLEDGIVEYLQDLSHAANRLLQKSDILPARLPEPVLEVAARADLATDAAASPPNLLNLVVETESKGKKESTMQQVMAVRLRLSEIEFSDTSATVWRSKIRDLMAQLSKLGREYQKKQKERSIAQAEAAWRSSWYED